MKRIFYTAGGLLCLDGVIHFAKLAAGAWEPNAGATAVLTGLFGLVYLVIGVLLLRLRESMVWPGIIAPAIGLLLTLIGLKPNPDTFTIAFIVLDVLAIAACLYIMFLGRTRLHRVS